MQPGAWAKSFAERESRSTTNGCAGCRRQSVLKPGFKLPSLFCHRPTPFSQADIIRCLSRSQPSSGQWGLSPVHIEAPHDDKRKIAIIDRDLGTREARRLRRLQRVLSKKETKRRHDLDSCWGILLSQSKDGAASLLRM